MVLDGVGNVQQLLDLSGNGRHGAVQTNSGARPSWNASGLINNQPTFSLDGASTYLVTANLGLAPPYTILAIATANTSGTAGVLIDGTADAREAVYQPNGTQTTWFADDASDFVMITATVQPGGSRVELYHDTSSLNFRLDAVSGSTSTSNHATITTMIIGTEYVLSGWWGGDFAALILWSSVLTSLQQTAMRTAVHTRFNL